MPVARVSRLLAIGAAIVAAGPAVPWSIAPAAAEDAPVLLPGVAVVDTPDGASAATPTALPLTEQHITEQHVTEQHVTEQHVTEQHVTEQHSTDGGRLLDGGIVATFEPGVPEAARHAARVGVAMWDDVLAFDPAAPVEVRFRWEPLGDHVLGYGGPTWFVIHPDLGPDLWPVGLANTLAGTDLNTATPEVVIGVNADLDWHLDPTSAPPADRPDLLTTILHELGHGLGFVSSLTIDSGGLDPALRLAFDRALLAETPAGPVPLAEVAVADRPAALTDALSVRLPDSTRWLLHTPSTLTPGSSVSHFHEDAHPYGSAGSLMSPSQHRGEAERSIDAATIGVMASIGWPIDAGLLPALGVAADRAGDATTVVWHFDHRQTGQVPTWVRVAAGDTVAVVAAGSGQVVVPLVPGGTEVTVTPLTASGAEGATVTALSPTSAPTPTPTAPTPTSVDQSVGRHAAVIDRLYLAAFGRTPDPGGRAHWASVLDAGASITHVAAGLVDSPEFVAGRATWPAERLVDQLYTDVLGRPADPTGSAFWVGELARGRPIAEVVAAFVAAAVE